MTPDELLKRLAFVAPPHERGAELRGDEAAIAAMHATGKARFLPVWRQKHPFVVKDDICRAFLADLSGKLQPATLQGSACRAGPGDWTIKDAKPFSKSS